jgi:hypothetical protein
VRNLRDAPTARDACARAEVPASDLPRYGAALGALARSAMLVERTP